MTPHGVRAHLLISHSNSIWALARLPGCWMPSRQLSRQRAVVLPLCKDPGKTPAGRESLYSCCFWDSSRVMQRCFIGIDPTVIEEVDWKWQWKTVYLSPKPAYRVDPQDLQWLISRLSIGPSPPPFLVHPSWITSPKGDLNLELRRVTEVPLPWTGTRHVNLTFRCPTPIVARIPGVPRSREEWLVLMIGRCTAGLKGKLGSMNSLASPTNLARPVSPASPASPVSPMSDIAPMLGPHYVAVRWFQTLEGNRSKNAAHRCPEDHILLSDNLCISRTFESPVKRDGGRDPASANVALVVSFKRHTLNPSGETLELRIESCKLQPRQPLSVQFTNVSSSATVS